MADGKRTAELRRLAIERAGGATVGSGRMVAAALNALLSGLDTPALRRLAGLGRREEPDAPEVFDQVLAELGLTPLPVGREQALMAMARWWAERIVDGDLDPLAGADRILWDVSVELRHPKELLDITEGALLATDIYGPSTPPDQLRADILRAAREFLSGDA